MPTSPAPPLPAPVSLPDPVLVFALTLAPFLVPAHTLSAHVLVRVVKFAVVFVRVFVLVLAFVLVLESERRLLRRNRGTPIIVLPLLGFVFARRTTPLVLPPLHPTPAPQSLHLGVFSTCPFTSPPAPLTLASRSTPVPSSSVPLLVPCDLHRGTRF